MSILHTVNKSPFENNALDSCLRIAQAGNAILLIEDGVYAASSGNRWAKRLVEMMPDLKVFALQPDVDARGIQDSVMEGIHLVDYAGFVDLTVEYDKVQAWL